MEKKLLSKEKGTLKLQLEYIKDSKELDISDYHLHHQAHFQRISLTTTFLFGILSVTFVFIKEAELQKNIFLFSFLVWFLSATALSIYNFVIVRPIYQEFKAKRNLFKEKASQLGLNWEKLQEEFKTAIKKVKRIDEIMMRKRIIKLVIGICLVLSVSLFFMFSSWQLKILFITFIILLIVINSKVPL